MRALSLTLKNFLAYQQAKVDFAGLPIVALVGPNGAGKSSLVDGIRWPLTNRARGLAASENKRLIRRGGAETCKAEIVLQHAGADLAISRTPSAGSPDKADILKALKIADTDALEAALDAGAFLSLEPKQRKQLVFKLAGGDVNEAMLRANGIDDPEAIRLCLSKGFAAGEKHCAEKKRAENRVADEIVIPVAVDEEVTVGANTYALSAITPENVEASLRKVRAQRDDVVAEIAAGEQRAQQAAHQAAQRAPAAEAVESARRILAATEDRVAKAKTERADPAKIREQAQQHHAATEEPSPAAPAPYYAQPLPRVAAQDAIVQQLTANLEAAKLSPWVKVVAIADRLSTISKIHAEELLALAKANGGAGHVAIEFELSQARRVLEKAQADLRVVEAANEKGKADAAAALGAWSKAKSERDARVHAATTARNELLARASNVEQVIRQDEEAIRSAKASVTAAEARLAGIDASATATTEDNLPALRESLKALNARLTAGEAIATKVRAYHTAVAGAKVATERKAALVEAGKRFEAMEHALRPSGVMSTLVSAPLANLRSAIEAIAPKVLDGRALRLTDDWEVLLSDAPVSLASTSERWRVGAVLAIALGVVSGLRWCVLDEASVCVGKARDALLGTLLEAREFFDQVILVGSRSEAEMDALRPPPPALADVVGIWRVEAGTVSRVLAIAATAAA